ncbi:TonB-dependent receptor plug domain-containing protein [Chitinophaga arvensicola]|uniref:TonB-linked outer membrane protein, SusC/RagA family n=1 Tax=Chitinophaga arvensicola TaxID=29529 RepID=A0A1I0R7E1_9BACT|nr:TonB-dependent receptor plug domain-containing protein [Chitinophaga arvensicola]SEW36611.1 TonB-linked outer membrane protein, SusC/RagA family [Chitinophaga arvensicola]
MKSLLVICTLIALLVTNYATAQQKFTFSYRNISMEKMLAHMEEKSGYRFLYNPRLISPAPVSLKVRNATLSKALDKLLGDSLTYRFLDNKLVVISRKTHTTAKDTTTATTQEQVHDLHEVMVTALGIRKEARSLGYALQELKIEGSVMVKSREANAYSSLFGKVAGLTVSNSRYLYNDPQLYLRGKQPLIVVDGVPVNSDSWDLNIEDVASIVVLKSAAAAALYGQEGARGAIQVISKRGTSSKKGFEVSVNSTTELQSGAVAIPHAQHSYGPGDYFKYAFVDGKGGGTYDYDYNLWGPRLEGQLITQWDSPKDAAGNLVPLPWVAKNNHNLEDFLRTGILATNNIAVAGRNEQGDFRLSFTQMNQRGSIPNTRLGITTFMMSGGYKLGKKVRVDAQLAYNKQYAPNYPQISYGPESPIYELLIWGGSNFDIKDPRLKNYWYPGKEGLQQQWVEYTRYNNPWFNAYEYQKAFYKDVFTGYASMAYQFNDQLDMQLKTAFNGYFTNQHTNYPVSGLYYGADFNKVGAYAETANRYNQINNSLLLNYHRSLLPEVSMKATTGVNVQTIHYQNSSAHTAGGLVIPGIYTLQNSVKPIDNAQDYTAARQMLSAFFMTDFSYKNFLFLDLSGRVDKNSSMPANHDTYFYPQASVSVVLSDILKLPSPVSFLKLSASVANVGEGLTTSIAQNYSLEQTYDKGTTWQGFPSVNYATDNILYSKDIRPEFHTAYEAGLEIRLLQNRLGLKTQAYRSVDGPQIFNLSISNTSGYNYRKVNGLVTERRGLELTLEATPLQRPQLRWDMAMNWSSNISYLRKVYDTLANYMRVKVGERMDQLYINPFERNPATGAILYHSDGTPIINEQVYKFYGYTNPDWIVGTTQTITWKQLSLTLEFDGSFGGKIFNLLNYKMWQSGANPQSDNIYRYQDWLHRNDPGYKGTRIGVGDIVTSGEVKYDAHGNVVSDTRKFAPNTTPVLEQNWANSYETADERNYQSKTYFKLRGITFTYRMPPALIGKIKGLSAASLSLVMRNVMYFAQLKQIDLDHWAYNAESELEEPSMRSFGLNLNVKF